LLTARWSGARRTEIRKLHLDCLDAYPDGTPRLRLAAGKSLRERAAPVHEEAAQAIRDLVKLREAQPDMGIYDPGPGRPVRYLFLRNSVLANPDYLFARPLARICEDLAILNGDGKPATHAHRFRHTLGTQLAEKGRPHPHHHEDPRPQKRWHVDDLREYLRPDRAGRLPVCPAARRGHRRAAG
jgi:integrase